MFLLWTDVFCSPVARGVDPANDLGCVLGYVRGVALLEQNKNALLKTSKAYDYYVSCLCFIERAGCQSRFPMGERLEHAFALQARFCYHLPKPQLVEKDLAAPSSAALKVVVVSIGDGTENARDG